MARPRGTGALSAWEESELAHYARCGWTLFELACHYGISERTVSRILRRAVEPRRRSQSAAKREND